MYDYYKILDIPRTATLDEIKKAYRIKAKLVHPDVNNSAKANEVFLVVNEAYETLIDTSSRYLYDAKLNQMDTAKADADKKKHYYGSSVRNNTYSNSTYSGNFNYDWKSFNHATYKQKTDEDYYKQAPIIYNLFFFCGMFIGFIIAIVTIVGTFRDYWPKPFILISVLGFILIRQGWRGIIGKKTIISSFMKRFKK